jgi:hypothetical protein
VTRPVRIANFSGFYGDRMSAPQEMLDGGPIDFLTGDYLAELTLMILWKARRKDPSAGYATTFLRQMEQVLGEAVDRGVKIVADAGGLNPAGLAERMRELAARLGIAARIAHIEGDDLKARLGDLQRDGLELPHLDTGRPLSELETEPMTANAYLGSWGVVEALDRGADVVICPRITDAVLAVAPAAWWHKWRRDDWDRLAAAVVAGHVIECGPQATGGNYPFYDELGDMRAPGFPIAEIAEDGSTVITKHAAHGGAVTVGTVTAQLLYEIGGPRYANPDVVARFDTIHLEQEGKDRVRIDGVRGEPSPRETKVCINYSGGFRNSMTFVLAGLDVERKVQMTTEALFAKLGGRERFDTLDVELIPSGMADPPSNELAFSYLRITVKDRDPKKVGRAFSSACIELGLGGYAGWFPTTPPQPETEYAVYWPTLVPAEIIEEVVIAPDGERIAVPQVRGGTAADVPPPPAPSATAPDGPVRRVPLGLVAGARSGDKGGNANCGVWARSDAAYAWLRAFLDTERLRALLPEARDLDIDRYELPNLRALNFVLRGLLGEGVMSSTSMDPQAKSLGEYLRAKVVDVPAALLDGPNRPRRASEPSASHRPAAS